MLPPHFKGWKAPPPATEVMLVGLLLLLALSRMTAGSRQSAVGSRQQKLAKAKREGASGRTNRPNPDPANVEVYIGRLKGKRTPELRQLAKANRPGRALDPCTPSRIHKQCVGDVLRKAPDLCKARVCN